jgi:ubiquitin thioesterase OTU1
VKCGYPPRTLVSIPELPISSLGIEKGDQLMVTELKEPVPVVPRAPESFQPAIIPSAFTEEQGPDSPDSIPTSGGSLVHRVNFRTSVCLPVLKTSIDRTQ